jgi:hypothetical protein
MQPRERAGTVYEAPSRGYGRRMHHLPRLGLTAVAVLALGLAACSDDDSETVESIVEDIEQAARTAVTEAEAAVDEAATDAVEAAVRNLVAEQGEEQFTDAGYPLNDEGLSCQATASDGLDSVSVQCTGTTEAGEQAELTGETAEFPGESIVEVVGTFTGTVDGSEVFSTDVLGG